MNFGEVITRSWNIIWKNKILWLFGFFASLGAGGSGNNGSNLNFSLGSDDFPGGRLAVPAWVERLFDSAASWLPIVILLAILLFVVLVVLNTFGRIGLSRGAWLADQSSPGPQVYKTLDFATLWQAGRNKFWSVLLLIVLLWALVFTLAIIILIPVIGISVLTLGIGLICLFPLLCVLFIALWALTVITDLAVIGIVNEDRSLTDALGNAWAMFKARPVDIGVMALLLWIISMIAGVIVGLPLLLILAPVIGALVFQSDAFMRGGLVVSVVLFLLYLPVLLFAQSIIQAYIGTAWTLVYRRVSSLIQAMGRPVVIDAPYTPEA